MFCKTLPLVLLLATGMGKGEDPTVVIDRRIESEPMESFPVHCLDDESDLDPSEYECLTPLLNQMVVLAATPSINQRMKSIGHLVPEYTNYIVELYRITSVEDGIRYENRLRVMPQNFLIHTVIDEADDYSHYTPVLRSIELVKEAYSGTGRLPTRSLDEEGIPGHEKLSFNMLGHELAPGIMARRMPITRYYYRYIPQSENIKGILIQYGGWKQSCEVWEKKSNTTAVADKYGFILITACGSDYGLFSSVFKTLPGFNAGACCTTADINDVLYTRIILAKENRLRRLPVYGYGYSNGGMMVQTLLCRKIIDTGVTLNGVMALKSDPESSFEACDKLYKNPRRGRGYVDTRLANIHCLDDERVPFDGEAPKKLWDKIQFYLGIYFIPGAKLPAIDENMRRWAERVGCQANTTSTTNISSWTQQKEWTCPTPKRVVSIERSNCTYHGRAHRVIKTSDFDPARWAAEFFLDVDKA